MFNPHFVLDDPEIMTLAGRVYRKAVEASTVTDSRVLAVQALGSAERSGAVDVRSDVIERLSNLLTTLDDLQSDALAVGEWISEARP